MTDQQNIIALEIERQKRALRMFRERGDERMAARICITIEYLESYAITMDITALQDQIIKRLQAVVKGDEQITQSELDVIADFSAWIQDKLS